jgi:hypothetical protein
MGLLGEEKHHSIVMETIGLHGSFVADLTMVDGMVVVCATS